MDPIRNGSTIFREVAEKYKSKKIQDPQVISALLGELLGRTSSWVILDFLDTANWDKIEHYELDQKKRLLTLVWHDSRQAQESEEERELRQVAFPASLYALGIQVNSIAPIIGKEAAIFLINGYAKTEKEINTIYKQESSEFKILDNSFFEKRVIRKISGHWEIIDFHCTPIYSLAILPKNCWLSSSDSKNMLYRYNIDEALNRLSAVIMALDGISEFDYNAICEKENIVRRIVEFVLKIECCYKDLEIKYGYSQILLGQLATLVKKSKDENIKQLLNKLAEMLNKFSHDSGKPVELNKAILMATLALAYTKLFRLECQIGKG